MVWHRCKKRGAGMQWCVFKNMGVLERLLGNDEGMLVEELADGCKILDVNGNNDTCFGSFFK